MTKLRIEECPFMGPRGDDQPAAEDRELPDDYASNPFRYLPPEIELSAAELELADKYENGDFSGGYLSSQIAYFRRPKSETRHRERRDRFQRLKRAAESKGLILPEELIRLVETDDYVDRLRHNTIWLQLPDEVVPLPIDPTRWLFLIFGEGQGCGYWHLLLSPDGTHMVVFAEEPFGVNDNYVSDFAPDFSLVTISKCADSFSAWIVNYFFECVESDKQYEAALSSFPHSSYNESTESIRADSPDSRFPPSKFN